jgi:hypothetical protein
MKRFLTACLIFSAITPAMAQLENKPSETKKDWAKVDLSKRSSDHLMFQFGYSGWAPKPDSIVTSGFSRSFNAYFLFDFPFKSNPKLSVGIGVGVGTDNIFFKNTTIDLKNRNQALFRKDSITQYKKYKMVSGYVEAPLELRYASNPENMNKSFKFAIGTKVGLPIDAHTKAKVDRDVNGFGGYVAKEKDKKYLNNIRVVGTIRVGYGNFSLFGTYSVTQLFREGQGPKVRPFTAGICLSGL